MESGWLQGKSNGMHIFFLTKFTSKTYLMGFWSNNSKMLDMRRKITNVVQSAELVITEPHVQQAQNESFFYEIIILNVFRHSPVIYLKLYEIILLITI